MTGPRLPGRHARSEVPHTIFVSGGAPLGGELHVPGDKSISHRALLIGALGEGTTLVRGLSDGDDVRRTRDAVVALGAEVHDDGQVVTVTGGRGMLHAPSDPVDCGNSGTGMRLLAGLVAGLEGETVLVGDESLSERPMDRIASPLSAMGAAVTGRGDRCLPPLTVKGGRLRCVEWEPEVASAQVKSAVLLAALFAEGETVVHERVRTRPHTEELLRLAGAEIEVVDEGSGRTVRVLGPAVPLVPLDLVVPGDPSQSAFWVVAACIVPKSALRVRGVYAGETRTGFLSVLRRMGARVEVDAVSRGADEGGRAGGLETADVTARSGPLRGTVVEASEIPSLDEVPILAVAAATARGTTRFVGMGELRVKESDRLEAVARLVRAVGAGARIEGDDLVVEGVGDGVGDGVGEGVGEGIGDGPELPGHRLRHFRFDSEGDHRMAMAAAVAAMAAGTGESRIDQFEGVATSYPAFVSDMRHVGGRARVWLVAIDGPAGSGKSTVSRGIAKRLGLERLDTGAMYRAVAWAVIDRGISPHDAPCVAELAHGAAIDPGPPDVVIDGKVVTGAIRTPEVNEAVSAVAANASVRAALVERQRGWAAIHGGGVVEGRDIGTVVFPGADLKVFLTAEPEERARRRKDEAAEGVARRDELDSTRAASPLARAGDARLLDTTGRSVDGVIEEILSWLR